MLLFDLLELAGGLREACLEAIDDSVALKPDRLGVGLLEDRPDQGGDELLGAARGLGLEVGRNVRAAALSARAWEGGSAGILEARTGVRDDQLDAAKAPAEEASQEAQAIWPRPRG